MAFGGFLGGLANLGAIAGGAQRYQEQAAQTAMQNLRLQALAQQLRQQALLDQYAPNILGAIAQPPSGQIGYGQGVGQDIQTGLGGGAGPSYAPGAVTSYQLPPLLPQVPSFGPSGGMPAQLPSPAFAGAGPPQTVGGYGVGGAGFGQPAAQTADTGGLAVSPDLQQSPFQQQADAGGPPDTIVNQWYPRRGPAYPGDPGPMFGGGPGTDPRYPRYADSGTNGAPQSLKDQILGLESEGDPTRMQVGAAGELGPMQIAPATARGYGFDVQRLASDPRYGRAAGERIVDDLWRKSGGDPRAVLVGYNAGEGAMRAYQRAGDDPRAARLAPAYQQALGQDIARTGQAFNRMGAHPEITSQSSQGARDAAMSFDPRQWGIIPVWELAQRIDKAMPGAPASVKLMALTQIQKLMAPDDRIMAQLALAQNREDFRREMFDLNERLRLQLAGMPQRQGYQILTDPSNNQQFMMIPGQPGSAVTLTGEPYKPGGAAKLGTQPKQGPLSDAQAKYLAKIYQISGNLPPGIARSSAAITQIMNALDITDQTPGDFVANLGSKKADQASLTNMTKIADSGSAYMRTAMANFDQAMKLAPKGIPTDWGPWVNRWIATGQTQFGGEDVPAYVTALLTAANEYAKVMQGSTGAQGATVDARREAAELFSPYLSQGQIAAVVRVAQNEMQNRLRENYAQLDDIKKRLREAGTRGPTPVPGAEGTAPRGSAAPATGNISQMSLEEVEAALQSGTLSPEQVMQAQDRLRALGVQ